MRYILKPSPGISCVECKKLNVKVELLVENYYWYIWFQRDFMGCNKDNNENFKEIDSNGDLVDGGLCSDI